ncbi:MAG: hypothetical protein OXE75_11770 [bacterium]|nr:hypothetical protein [bacterium]
MLSPEGLLDAARHLVPVGPGRPRVPRLRRAISTAYYATFAALTQEVARHYPANAARHAVRRLVGHGAVRNVCAAICARASVPWLPGNPSCHPHLLRFAEDFESLFSTRVYADYDHDYACTKEDALNALSVAARAIDALASAREQCPEQLDIACVAAIADDRRRRHLSKPRIG